MVHEDVYKLIKYTVQKTMTGELAQRALDWWAGLVEHLFGLPQRTPEEERAVVPASEDHLDQNKVQALHLTLNLCRTVGWAVLRECTKTLDQQQALMCLTMLLPLAVHTIWAIRRCDIHTDMLYMRGGRKHCACTNKADGGILYVLKTVLETILTDWQTDQFCKSEFRTSTGRTLLFDAQSRVNTLRAG